jgi:hypothetical protein
LFIIMIAFAMAYQAYLWAGLQRKCLW